MSYSGWQWYPGTAAWVTPTALTILALEKVSRRKPEPAWRARIETGREFLLSRMCQDGGWNQGSNRTLGFAIDSYPETTVLALLALTGRRRQDLEKSLSCAERHLASCRSVEGRSWLAMALLAPGRTPPTSAPIPPAFRNLIDMALSSLRKARRGQDRLPELASHAIPLTPPPVACFRGNAGLYRVLPSSGR